MRPWTVLDRVEGHDGVLELRSRGAADLVIALDGRILMTSRASGSEAQLGMLVAQRIRPGRAPRLLIGGLGMGVTLRAALDVLPADASVEVVELNSVVVEWCRRGPLATLTRNAVTDARVRTLVGDVADRIRLTGDGDARDRFDGIALDLYEGLRPSPVPDDDPVYGTTGLARARAALHDGGVLGRWSEQADPAFETRLGAAGFAVRSERVGDRGRRHTVCLGIAERRARRC